MIIVIACFEGRTETRTAAPSALSLTENHIAISTCLKQRPRTREHAGGPNFRGLDSFLCREHHSIASRITEALVYYAIGGNLLLTSLSQFWK